MISKGDLERMLSPLPADIRKRYLDRVLSVMETEKEDRSVFRYILRTLFHDFVKPIDMMNALNVFVSFRGELGIEDIALDSPDVSLTNEGQLLLYAKLRSHFFEIVDKLGFGDEFKDFVEISLDFLKVKGER